VYGWGKNFYVADYDENKNLKSEPYTLTAEELDSYDGALACDKKSAHILGKGETYEVNEALRKVAEYKIKNDVKESLSDVVPFYVTASQAERELEQKEKEIANKEM
jgi:NTP pyrophosphatase (non-canonical NTP hydrolase)